MTIYTLVGSVSVSNVNTNMHRGGGGGGGMTKLCFGYQGKGHLIEVCSVFFFFFFSSSKTFISVFCNLKLIP